MCAFLFLVTRVVRIELFVLKVAETGVGKTSLVQFMCNGEVSPKVHMTIGCAIELKLHQHRGGSKAFFIEFWDVGGTPKHEKSRKLFYSQIDGVNVCVALT